MPYSFETIRATIENLPVREEPDPGNIFAIGTRGYYENPFTEVLAYIISHNQDFLRLFLESLGNLDPTVINSYMINAYIDTQHTTVRGNRIDLIVFNDEYALVFENKIGHRLANPLEDYENNFRERYGQLTHFYYIFSYVAIEYGPINWSNVLIGDSFSHIKTNIIINYENKWGFYFEDFLNHYINNSTVMDAEEFGFYAKKFAIIHAARQKVNDFISEIIHNIENRLLPNTIDHIGEHDSWGEYIIARRLYPFQNRKDNIALAFKKDGEFTIRIYYYQAINFHQNIRDIVGIGNYKHWTERKNSILCFERFITFQTVGDLTAECNLQVINMVNYYAIPPL